MFRQRFCKKCRERSGIRENKEGGGEKKTKIQLIYKSLFFVYCDTLSPFFACCLLLKRQKMSLRARLYDM